MRHYEEKGIHIDYKEESNEDIAIENYTFNESVKNIEDVKTPDELLRWMKKSILYTHENHFKSYKEVLDTLKGDCHDQTEFESHYFRKMGIKHGKLFIIEYKDWNQPGGSTHSLLFFYKNDKIYWFENAWEDEYGIHGPYKTMNELKDDICKRWKFSGNFDKLLITSVKGVKPGMTLNEYVNSCLSNVTENTKPYYQKESVIDTGVCFYINESYDDIITESIDNRGLYHLSKSENIKIIKPSVPDNYMTKNGYEDGKTPRVCFAPTINQCLMALTWKCPGEEFYVYTPSKKYNTHKATKKEVPDSNITEETWILEPVSVNCVGKIKVIKDKGEKGHKYTYGNNTAELYDWEWKEIPMNESAIDTNDWSYIMETEEPKWKDKYINGFYKNGNILLPSLAGLCLQITNENKLRKCKEYLKEIEDSQPINYIGHEYFIEFYYQMNYNTLLRLIQDDIDKAKNYSANNFKEDENISMLIHDNSNDIIYRHKDKCIYQADKTSGKAYKLCTLHEFISASKKCYLDAKSILQYKEKTLNNTIEESTIDINDWSYIMETEEPIELFELEEFLEATGGNAILRDSIYPYIETAFKTNPTNVRKFNSLVGQFIDRNIDKLTTSGPVYLIPFTDKDKNDYYELFNIEESHIKKIMKEHTAKLNASKFKLLNQNPIFALFYFVIRYFTLHPDKKSLNSALTIYALSAYPSIFSKYFPNGVIEPVMQYTIDNLTDKFLIKKTGHILGLLVESIQHSYDFLKSPMREATDAEVIRFIQRIRNDHNSIFKKIANVYMDNYRNNRGVIITNTNYDDDTPIIDEVDNATTEVSNAINKVLLPIVQNGVDIVRAEAAAKMAGISVSDCRMFLNNIINDKNTDLLQKFIESLLFLYIYEDHRTIRDVRSQYFLRWAASLFKKTNSKNKNILQINEVLNIWAENSGIYAKFHREASRINYKKAIFFYVVLSVQKYIG